MQIANLSNLHKTAAEFGDFKAKHLTVWKQQEKSEGTSGRRLGGLQAGDDDGDDGDCVAQQIR